MAGFINEYQDTPPKRTSVDVLQVEIGTGNVQWQAISGDNLLATDGDNVFVTTESKSFHPSGIAAYDINSGEMKWRTYFQMKDAIGNEHFATTSDGLFVETYNRTKTGFYLLDPSTGELKETPEHILALKKQPFYKEFIHFDGLIFEKQENSRIAH